MIMIMIMARGPRGLFDGAAWSGPAGLPLVGGPGPLLPRVIPHALEEEPAVGRPDGPHAGEAGPCGYEGEGGAAGWKESRLKAEEDFGARLGGLDGVLEALEGALEAPWRPRCAKIAPTRLQELPRAKNIENHRAD